MNFEDICHPAGEVQFRTIMSDEGKHEPKFKRSNDVSDLSNLLRIIMLPRYEFKGYVFKNYRVDNELFYQIENKSEFMYGCYWKLAMIRYLEDNNLQKNR